MAPAPPCAWRHAQPLALKLLGGLVHLSNSPLSDDLLQGSALAASWLSASAAHLLLFSAASSSARAAFSASAASDHQRGLWLLGLGCSFRAASGGGIGALIIAGLLADSSCSASSALLSLGGLDISRRGFCSASSFSASSATSAAFSSALACSSLRICFSAASSSARAAFSASAFSRSSSGCSRSVSGSGCWLVAWASPPRSCSAAHPVLAQAPARRLTFWAASSAFVSCSARSTGWSASGSASASCALPFCFSCRP